MSDGIKRLINVTQLKSANANEEAMAGAEKQKSLIDKQKLLRGAQSAFEEATKDSAATLTEGKSMAGAIHAEATVAKPSHYLGRFIASASGASSKFSASDLLKNLDVVGSNPTRFASGISSFIEAFKKTLEESKDLETKDKMGNSEIQSLMSAYNESSQLASSTKKKMDDQNASIIGKIG